MPAEDPSKGGVTVVVPAYRAERTIRRTVDSLLADPAVTTIVVVIDGAFDRTEEVLADYGGERVRVVARAENLGASRTRNEGLTYCATELVMFVDADDFVEDRLIGGLAEAIGSSGADIAFGPMEILYETEGRRAPRFVPDFASPSDIFRRWHLEGVYVNPVSVIWRTEFIRGIGGWDPDITRNDDGELVMRAVLMGAKIAVAGEGAGVYVKHSSHSMNHRTDNMSSLLLANEKLLAIKSASIPPGEQRRVCAGHYFNIAWHAYTSGRDDLGDEALKRSRAMGFGTRGPLRYRIGFALLGLKRTVRLLGWLKRRRLRPRSA